MQQVAATSSMHSTDLDAPFADRGRLDGTIRRVAEMQQALETGTPHAEPATLLSELRVDLELYFALVESDAYFGRALRQQQSLSHNIGDLRRGHSEILHQLGALREVAADLRRGADLRTQTLRLLDQFRVLEDQERELLQDLVLHDDGTGAD